MARSSHATLRIYVVTKVKGSISHARALWLRTNIARNIIFEILLQVGDIIWVKLKATDFLTCK